MMDQFVIGLNIIEDFLVGEGIKYLRLVCYKGLGGYVNSDCSAGWKYEGH